MAILINTIKPQTQLENYVEMFLRTNAQPADKYVNLFHQTYYGGARTQPPSPEEIAEVPLLYTTSTITTLQPSNPPNLQTSKPPKKETYY